jgi:ribosomal protein S18 acetylase RimI-like enzyme
VDVSLRELQLDDLALLPGWVEAIGASRYMSRSSPKYPQVAQYVILVDGEPVGTVWLEKENEGDQEAVLGILIGREDKLGQGIGRTAIRLAIKQAEPSLGFRSVRLNVRKNNPRAVSCYRRCGFEVIAEGEGANQHGEVLQFFEMRLNLES